MVCNKCGGKVLLERLFSSNKDFETSCIICGKRDFVPKESRLGLWLARHEKELRLASGL
jgi:hypothetical protein